MKTIETGHQDLEQLVAGVCNLSMDDDIEYIREVVNACHSVLKSNAIDTLRAIYLRGPLGDGDVPSKTERNTLLSIGVINKCVVKGEDGYQACNYLGRDVLRVLSLKG